ncbi:hypothetical protein HDU96_005838 [Phlyctochytrium bullatum]|nr:hypothetical protein HDU96_005838 [Phlyctochytrium bullatum]
MSHKILFFGTDAFSVACCSRLLREVGRRPIASLDVVTPPDCFKTKRPEALLKTFARLNGIRHMQAPPKTLRGWKPDGEYDLAVVVSFGYFLPAELLDRFPLGALNVHPSLLPKYRGASPMQHAILNADAATGVSIIEVDKTAFDCGEILYQSKMKLNPDVSYQDLSSQLARLGAEDLLTVIKDLDHFRTVAWRQKKEDGTRAPKFSKFTGGIAWDSMDATKLYTLHRALSPKIVLTATFKKKRLQLTVVSGVRPQEQGCTEPPGTAKLSPCGQHVLVRCALDWLVVSGLKMEGRTESHAYDFANGHDLRKRTATFLSYA